MAVHKHLPVNEEDIVATYELGRYGFCNAQERLWILNCAHTMAAANFKHLLSQLENTGLFPQERLPFKELSRILANIYMSDHLKGDTEKKLALLLDRNGNEGEVGEVRQLLKQIQTEHRNLTRSLAELHRTILLEIDCLLNDIVASS